MPTAHQKFGGEFRLLVAARACLWLAGGITGVVLPLALYQRTHDASLTALLAGLEAAPYLLVGLLAGAVADRTHMRRIAITACTIAALGSGSIAAVSLFGEVSVPHFFVSAGATGIAMVFFDAAMFAGLPAMVPRDRLARAFASMTAFATLIGLASPMVGGFLAAAITPEHTLAIDSALCLLAALIFAIIREPQRTLSPGHHGVWKDIAEGLHFIRSQPVIRTLTTLGIGNSVAEGILSGLLVASVAQTFMMDDDGPFVGIAYTALSAGALIGTQLIPVVRERFSVRTVAVAGLLCGAVGIIGWSQQPHYAVGVGALVIYQVGATSVILNGISERARLTPDYLQGRVNTSARMIAWGGQPIGALIGAAAVMHLGIAGTHQIAIVLLLLTAGLMYVLLRHAPSATEGPSPSPCH